MLTPRQVEQGQYIRINENIHAMLAPGEISWQSNFQEVVLIQLDPDCPSEAITFWFSINNGDFIAFNEDWLDTPCIEVA